MAQFRCWLVLALLTASASSGTPILDEGSIPSSSAEGIRRSGKPCARVSYADHQAVFIVDTGAEGSLVCRPDSMINSPNEEWRIQKVSTTPVFGPSHNMTLIHNVPISTFGDPAVDSSLCYEPLFEIPGRFGGGLAGILGLPNLSSNRLRVNIPELRCETAAVAKSATTGVTNLKLEKRIGKFKWIKAELPVLGSEVWIVDTGDSGCISLRPPTIALFQRLGILKPAGTVRRGSVTVSDHEVNQYILQSLTIDRYTFVDIPVIEGNYREIGMGCLSHFDMVFDFPNETLELRPLTKDWPVRIPPDASGMLSAYFDDNVLKVVRLESDRAAMKAGLALDDQILMFDGKEPKDLSMHAILARLRQGGTTLPLRIRRGNRDFDVSLKLDWPFEYPPKWPDRSSQVEEFESFLREKQNK